MELFATLTPDLVPSLLAWLPFGILVGMLSAMLGIGGGVIMVPAFRLVGGLTPLVSSATSLFVIVPTGIAGVWRHLRAGTCRVGVGLAAGLAGACTSVLGARLAHVAPGWSIIAVVAVIIAYSAVTMLGKALRQPGKVGKMANTANAGQAPDGTAELPANAAAAAAAATTGAPAPASASAPLEEPAPLPQPSSRPFAMRDFRFAVLIGTLAGVLSGFVGVGGGFIMVPMLCSLLHMDMKHAAGTSLLAVCCLATPAALAQLLAGSVEVLIGCAVIVGSIFGTVLGQRLAVRLPDRVLRFAFSVLLFTTAILLVLNELGV